MSEEFEWSNESDLRDAVSEEQHCSEDFQSAPVEADSGSHGTVPEENDPPYSSSNFAGSTGASISDAPKKAKKSRGKGFFKGLLWLVVIGAMVGGGCFLTARQLNRYYNTQIRELHEQIGILGSELIEQKEAASNPDIIRIPANKGDTMTPAQVYAANVNSVVAVSCTVRTSMFGRVTEGTSTGSGFIVSEDGYVVTNYHVVENASSIRVITNDGSEYTATLVGKDAANDVAVLKAEAEGLAPVELGDSNSLFIGDMVVAIGNPLGTLSATQTVGYISGKDRRVTTDNTVINMLQTDAAINSGNSGGPLFNMYGQVVGITSAKYSGTTSSGASIEGISFAIPIDDVKSIITDLKDFGYVNSGYLGVMVQNMDSGSAAMYNLPNGAYVSSVTEGSCAERAGIQAKDIITKLGDTQITSINDLTRALRSYKAGDETTVTVVRAGQEIVLNVTLDEKPREEDQTPSQEGMPSEGSYDEWFDYFNRFFGNGG